MFLNILPSTSALNERCPPEVTYGEFLPQEGLSHRVLIPTCAQTLALCFTPELPSTDREEI